MNRGVPRERPTGFGNSAVKNEPGVEQREVDRPRKDALVN
jgi:hypothetical protein